MQRRQECTAMGRHVRKDDSEALRPFPKRQRSMLWWPRCHYCFCILRCYYSDMGHSVGWYLAIQNMCFASSCIFPAVNWQYRTNGNPIIQILDQAKDSVTSVKIRGHLILSGSVDGYMRCYDVRKGVLTADHIGAPITSISLSSDMNCILVNTLDSTIRLFDRSNGKLLGTYTGHVQQHYKTISCFSNDDALVLSGSEDGKVVVWDILEVIYVRISIFTISSFSHMLSIF